MSSEQIPDNSLGEKTHFTTHSFILKFWLEEVDEETGNAIWRGSITHIPDNSRRYVNNLEEVSAFILTYLRDSAISEPGFKTRMIDRLKHWLKDLT